VEVARDQNKELEMPTCPDCNEEMVKSHIELEDHWRTAWLCACIDTPMLIEDIDAVGAELEIEYDAEEASIYEQLANTGAMR
jgi:hypothetical protein